jgi:hypothetical protein
MQPASVVPVGHVHAVAAADVSVGVQGIVDAVDSAQELSDRVNNGGQLTTADFDTVLKTASALLVNTPSVGPHIQLGVGVAPRVEVDFRYALQAIRFGARYQFLGVPAVRELGQGEGQGFAGTAGFGYSRYVGAAYLPSEIDSVVLSQDTSRNELDIPLTFGWSNRFAHFWFGPKYLYSKFSHNIGVCFDLDDNGTPSAGSNGCQSSGIASLSGSAHYLAGQVGVAVGYRYVWLALELTAARMWASADGVLTDGSATVSGSFSPRDVVVAPTVGFLVRL